MQVGLQLVPCALYCVSNAMNTLKLLFCLQYLRILQVSSPRWQKHRNAVSIAAISLPCHNCLPNWLGVVTPSSSCGASRGVHTAGVPATCCQLLFQTSTWLLLLLNIDFSGPSLTWVPSRFPAQPHHNHLHIPLGTVPNHSASPHHTPLILLIHP